MSVMRTTRFRQEASDQNGAGISIDCQGDGLGFEVCLHDQRGNYFRWAGGSQEQRAILDVLIDHVLDPEMAESVQAVISGNAGEL